MRCLYERSRGVRHRVDAGTQFTVAVSACCDDDAVLRAVYAYALTGVTAMIRRGDAARLADISRVMLYPALALLTIGIFIGAVWASVSWGRYWGWDPKEVWALITMIAYALPAHPSLLPTLSRPRVYHIYTIAAFVSVLITYFGVNFILGGLHGYA